MTKAPKAASLRQLRQWRGLTQVEAGRRFGVPQGEISKIEKRSDHRVRNLARYIEALGGRLELVAVVGGRRVSLKGV